MSVLFLLPWQFSQFVLVTQCLSLLVLHISRLLPPSHIRRLYWTLAAALLINILVQFANSLLLMSLLPCTVLACLVSWWGKGGGGRMYCADLPVELGGDYALCWIAWGAGRGLCWFAWGARRGLCTVLACLLS